MRYALIDTWEREGRVQAEREAGPGRISILESRGEVLWSIWAKTGLVISHSNEQGFGELHRGLF